MGKRPRFEEWNEYIKHGFCIIGKETLNKNSLVIDVGAHRGWFTGDVLEKFNCSVIAVEPTPNFIKDLKKLKEKYNKLEIIDKAAWKNNKDIVKLYDFNGLPNSLIERTFSKKRKFKIIPVKTITLDDIIDKHEKIDYLKINVEGSEIEILQGASVETLKKCKQICVQYHNWLSKKMSKPITMEEVNKSIERIEKIGFKKTIYDKHPNVHFKNINKGN